MSQIRVVIADDHETVRQGLRLLIDSQQDMLVVGEAPNGRVAVERAASLQPHVMVLDVSMPEMNGLAATRAVREATPGTAVVALTRYTDSAYVRELLRAGATAYVLKQSASSELLTAIRHAAAGRSYLDARIANGEDPLRRPGRSGGSAPRITEREQQVLREMAVGYSNKEIAAHLDVSIKTVEVHKANAMRKLGLHRRLDVVRFALLQGWLQDP